MMNMTSRDKSETWYPSLELHCPKMKCGSLGRCTILLDLALNLNRYIRALFLEIEEIPFLPTHHFRNGEMI